MRLLLLSAIAVTMAAASASALAQSTDLRAPDQQAPAAVTADLRAPDQQAPASGPVAVAPAPAPADTTGGPSAVAWVLIGVAGAVLVGLAALYARRWHRTHAIADDLVPQ